MANRGWLFGLVFVGCGDVDPAINGLKPLSVVPPCSIQIMGVFANITQAYVVDNSTGEKMPMAMESLQRHSTNTVDVDGTVPAVPAGTYKVALEQNGGN